MKQEGHEARYRIAFNRSRMASFEGRASMRLGPGCCSSRLTARSAQQWKLIDEDLWIGKYCPLSGVPSTHKNNHLVSMLGLGRGITIQGHKTRSENCTVPPDDCVVPKALTFSFWVTFIETVADQLLGLLGSMFAQRIRSHQEQASISLGPYHTKKTRTLRPAEHS